MSLSEQDYRNILQKYDEKRSRALQQRDLRIQEVYTKVPEISRIDRQIESFGIRSIQAYLQSHENPVELMKKVRTEVEDLRKRRSFLLRLAGYTEEDLQPVYECPYCQDTGFIDGKRCRCFEQQLIESAYERSHLKALLQQDNFHNFDLECFSPVKRENEPCSARTQMETILSAVRRDLEAFPSQGPINYLFTGSTGTGKTFLAGCIAKELLDKGFTVLYLSAYDLAAQMSDRRFHYRDSESDSDAIQFIQDCDLLIIDDLGTEAPIKTSAADVLHLIDLRIQNGRSTILTTNLELSAIGKLYTDRLVSRLLGSYRLLRFLGADLRLSHLGEA